MWLSSNTLGLNVYDVADMDAERRNGLREKTYTKSGSLLTATACVAARTELEVMLTIERMCAWAEIFKDPFRCQRKYNAVYIEPFESVVYVGSGLCDSFRSNISVLTGLPMMP